MYVETNPVRLAKILQNVTFCGGFVRAIAITDRGDDGEHLGAGRDDSSPRRIEIVLPRARSIVWLGIKVYLIVLLAVSALAITVVFLVVAVLRLQMLEADLRRNPVSSSIGGQPGCAAFRARLPLPASSLTVYFVRRNDFMSRPQ